jgi:hypothetical protein
MQSTSDRQETLRMYQRLGKHADALLDLQGLQRCLIDGRQFLTERCVTGPGDGQRRD